MEQRDSTKSKLSIALLLLGVIAIASIIYAVSKRGEADRLSAQLEKATAERDSLAQIVIDQSKLLQAEGDQFQNDLLKIDSLENVKE